jgi:hypothetical protein
MDLSDMDIGGLDILEVVRWVKTWRWCNNKCLRSPLICVFDRQVPVYRSQSSAPILTDLPPLTYRHAVFSTVVHKRPTCHQPGCP